MSVWQLFMAFSLTDDVLREILSRVEALLTDLTHLTWLQLSRVGVWQSTIVQTVDPGLQLPVKTVGSCHLYILRPPKFIYSSKFTLFGQLLQYWDEINEGWPLIPGNLVWMVTVNKCNLFTVVIVVVWLFYSVFFLHLFLAMALCCFEVTFVSNVFLNVLCLVDLITYFFLKTRGQKRHNSSIFRLSILNLIELNCLLNCC